MTKITKKVKPPMTVIQIINETVAYYSEDTSRRAVIEDKCKYKDPKGRRCAYSRCWKKYAYKKKYEDVSANTLSDLIGATPDKLLQDEYKGHILGFWMNLQSLHDNRDNWNEKGLTVEGKKYVKWMKSRWKGK